MPIIPDSLQFYPAGAIISRPWKPYYRMSKIHLIAQLKDFYPVFYYLYSLKKTVDMNALGIFLAIGPWQIAVIVVIVLLLFGGKKIPELMRGLGSGIKEFKDASREDDKLEEKQE